MERTELKEAATVFGLLSDPSRVGILAALRSGPKSAVTLCKILGLKPPTLSHHLALLRMGRLITGTRKGREIEYITATPGMSAVASIMKKLMPKK